MQLHESYEVVLNVKPRLEEKVFQRLNLMMNCEVLSQNGSGSRGDDTISHESKTWLGLGLWLQSITSIKLYFEKF